MLLGKQALGGWLFDNYQVTSILSDAGTSVVYSVTTINNERFIIKVALPSKINQLENEFWISKRLINNHFVPQPLEMRSSESLAAIFWKEEINYISLDQYLSTTHRIPPNEFLTIAEQIAEAVHLVHSAGIIHRDLSSANFLIEPVTKSIKLIGFTNSVFWKESVSSSFYSSEPPYCGTYQFISPEHTGKLQTVVDFRSDLYSIGMVFHQMLLGHTPFEPIKNLTSLIYAHTAVQIPLIDHYQEIDIPIVLGHIVAKLLEKDTRRRYQSSLGLQADLKQAATFLEKTLPKDFRTLSIVRFKQQIPSSNSQAQLEYLRTMSRHAAQTFEQAGNCPMKLGNFDKCSVLRQAHTIFGREEELSNILNIWKNTLNKSAAVFIKGNSGLGKS
jgi:serine/threonine protein kinase